MRFKQTVVAALWVILVAAMLPMISTSQGPNNSISPGHSLTMLANGEWLLIGARIIAWPTASAVIVNTRNNQVRPAGALIQSRSWHTATALPDGKVLIVGGTDPEGRILAAPEIFDPERQSFEALPPSDLTPRAHHTATLLTDGSVLLAGGTSEDGSPLKSADIWDFRTRTGRKLASEMMVPRSRPNARLLPDGSVLLWEGTEEADHDRAKEEIYSPWHQSFLPWYGGPPEREVPAIEGSFPESQAMEVPVDQVIGLRFSRRMLVDSVSPATVALSDGVQHLDTRVIPAEQGMLVFVTPKAPLLPATLYTLVIDGAKDELGGLVPYSTRTFRTAEGPIQVSQTSGLSYSPALAMVLQPRAADPANTKTIKAFLDCLNPSKPKSITDSVACLPSAACKFTVTMSTQSLQPACTIATVQFPRVILDCPGPAANLSFRPSYLLCPQGMQGQTRLSDHVELGEDADAVTFGPGDRQNQGDMFMGDVFVDPQGGYTAKKLEDVAIYGKDLQNFSKNTCESFCHKPVVDKGQNELARFPPINPFADFRGQNDLAQFVIFTDVDPAKYPGAKNAPKGSGQKKNFTNVCTAITNNKKQVNAADKSIPPAALDVVDALCKGLLAKVK
ncbi:MAG TPA: kelch repeat-containing protein [Bryobacteraceae bacterium]|nr:kelch repeat-containing protein [Bryobacteraceae bacterium]